MGVCPKCGAKLEADWRFCMNCATPVGSTPTSAGAAPAPAREPAPTERTSGSSCCSPPLTAPERQQGQRFLALRILAVVLKVFAVIEALTGLIVGAALAGNLQGASGDFFLAAYIGAWAGLLTWGAADLIVIVLAVEEHTGSAQWAAARPIGVQIR